MSVTEAGGRSDPETVLIAVFVVALLAFAFACSEMATGPWRRDR